MSSFGRFTQALGGVVETLSYASPTLTLTQSVGSSPLTATIPSGGISGSGTTNYLPKFTGSTIIGNSLLFDNGVNVGIGTAVGNVRFTIQQNFDTYAGGLAIRKTNNDTALFLYNDGSRNIISSSYGNTGTYVPLTFQTSDANRLSITSAGLVGIGTTNPLSILNLATDVNYSPSQSGQLYIGSANTNKRLMLGYDNNGSFGFIEGVNFGVAYSNICLNPTQGNVLIGTTTDAGYKLNVNGDIIANGSSQLYLNAGDLRFNSNAGYGIVTANGNRIVSIQNSSFSIDGTLNVSNNVTLNGASGTRILTIQNNTSGNAILSLVCAGLDSGSIYYDRTSSELCFSNSGVAKALKIATTGYATFSSAIAIGNTINATAPDVNTHKIEIEVGGNTYYLLATENP
jgi:hypothetical protein